MCWNEKAKYKMSVLSFFLFYAQSDLRWVPRSQGEKLKGYLDCISENIVNYVNSFMNIIWLQDLPVRCFVTESVIDSVLRDSMHLLKPIKFVFGGFTVLKDKNHTFHPKCIYCSAFQVMLDYWPIFNFPIFVTSERCEVAHLLKGSMAIFLLTSIR